MAQFWSCNLCWRSLLVFICPLSFVHLAFVLDAVLLLDPIGDVSKAGLESQAKNRDLVGLWDCEQRSTTLLTSVRPCDPLYICSRWDGTLLFLSLLQSKTQILLQWIECLQRYLCLHSNFRSRNSIDRIRWCSGFSLKSLLHSCRIPVVKCLCLCTS